MQKATINTILKPVSIPTAQYINLCEVVPQDDSISRTLKLVWSDKLKLSKLDKLVIELTYCHGLRISEILNISVSQLLPDGKIFIKGSKKSHNRIIQVAYSLDYVLFLKRTKSLNFTSFSRFYYYRLFKKIGLFIISVDSKNMKVTHGGRHYVLSSIQNNINSIEDTQRFSGHKNINNTKKYVNYGKQKDKNRKPDQ